ncbi:MAG: hypothetical protein RLZZ201_1217, partial [Actinomycetota bacterium]
DCIRRDLHRSLEAERRVGSNDVVVDGLWHTDDWQAVIIRQHRGDGERTVSTNHHECIKPEFCEHLLGALDSIRIIERTPATRAKDRAAFGQDASHLADVQYFVALLQHSVPRVVEAEHTVSANSVRLAHDCSDDGVQPGAITAAGQDTYVHYIKAKRTQLVTRRAPSTRLMR